MLLPLFQLRSKDAQKFALVAVPVVITGIVVHQLCKYFKIGNTRYCKNDKKEEKENSSYSVETKTNNMIIPIQDDIELVL